LKAILTIGLAVGLLGTGPMNAQNERPPKFAALSSEDSARLDQQRALVASAVRRHHDVALTRSLKDLPILQTLIDESVFNKTQTYELQSLGVAFGDVLASELPLHWAMVTDEYGTDPTLQYKSMPLNVNALTMISKRVEQGRKVNLQELLEITRQQLRTFEKNSH
jgi:hypothetical protein